MRKRVLVCGGAAVAAAVVAVVMAGKNGEAPVNAPAVVTQSQTQTQTHPPDTSAPAVTAPEPVPTADYGYEDSIMKEFAGEVLTRSFSITLTENKQGGEVLILKAHGSDIYCAVGTKGADGEPVLTAELYLIGSRMTAYDLTNGAVVDGFRSGSPYDSISDERLLARLYLDGPDNCDFSAEYDSAGQLTESFTDGNGERMFIIDQTARIPAEIRVGDKVFETEFSAGGEIVLDESAHDTDPAAEADLPIFL